MLWQQVIRSSLWSSTTLTSQPTSLHSLRPSTSKIVHWSNVSDLTAICKRLNLVNSGPSRSTQSNFHVHKVAPLFGHGVLCCSVFQKGTTEQTFLIEILFVRGLWSDLQATWFMRCITLWKNRKHHLLVMINIYWFRTEQLSMCKGKGKCTVDLYNASSRTPLTLSDMDHTVLPASNTIMPLPVSILQEAPPRTYA